MDPLLAKVLADSLANAPLTDRPRSPRRRHAPVGLRERTARTMRRWAEVLEPPTAEPVGCTLG
jgi:hypothetical protein